MISYEATALSHVFMDFGLSDQSHNVNREARDYALKIFNCKQDDLQSNVILRIIDICAFIYNGCSATSPRQHELR